MILKRRSKAFTLLEIMVVLVLLGFIGTLTGIQAKKLLEAHRFGLQTSNFLTALQEAQVLAAAYQTDIALDFMVKDGKVAYRFSSFEPFDAYQFDDREIFLTHAAKIAFNGKEISNFHFDIYAGGRIEPRGILGFDQTKEAAGKTFWLDLQHGHLIKPSSSPPAYCVLQVPKKLKELE